MFCIHCGKELSDDARFCPNCGSPVNTVGQPRPSHTAEPQAAAGNQTTEYQATAYQAAGNQQVSGVGGEIRPPKVWSIFSTIGKVLGIVCLCTAFIPYVNYFSLTFSIVGIVLSCLGKKARTEAAERNFRVGLTLSIIAAALSLVMIIVYFFVLFTVAFSTVMNTYY